MPRYCWQCPTCHEQREVTRQMKDSRLPETCDCGIPMNRDIIAEQCAVRGDYNEPVVSTSMAFNTQDLAEHRRRFPGVDLKVDRVGHTAYPILKSLSQKRQYTKARDRVDVNAFF